METINRLAAQQQETAEKIKKLLSNMKKDSQTRKTQEYIKVRFENLEELWRQFTNTHQLCEKYQDEEHTYFKIDYFSQAEKLYKEAKKYLQDLQQSSEDSATDSNQMEVSTIDKQLNTFRIMISGIQYKIRKIEALKQDSTSTPSLIKLHVHNLTTELQRLKDFHINWGNKDHQEEIWDLEDTILNIRAEAEASPAEKSDNHISLPQIKIPMFNGNYEEWATFHDMFEKTVHNNNSLSSTEKLQYLKTHLKDEPSKLIQHLPCTNSNYKSAWQILVERYSNKRIVLYKLIDKILDVPIVTEESSKKLKHLHDTIKSCLHAINNLGINSNDWDAIVARIVTRKWDPETNRLYEQSLRNPQEIQPLSSVMEFLERRFQSLESMTVFDKKTNFNESQSTKDKCLYCNQTHKIYNCSKFKELTVTQRIAAVKEKKICYNCLRHPSKDKCLSQSTCRICHKKHNTMIHSDQKPTMTTKKSTNASVKTGEEKISTGNEKTVLLATALIQARAVDNSYKYLRVLVDQGSQAAYLTEEAAQRLGLPREKVRAEIMGVGETELKSNWTMETVISPRFPSTFTLTTKFFVLPKLTKNMPPTEVEDTKDINLTNKIIADPTFNKPGPIDAIIGAEEYKWILLEGVIKVNNGLLAQNTELGWILSGPQEKNKKSIQLLSFLSQLEEDQQLTKFWTIEEVPNENFMSPEDQECEEHYKVNTSRHLDGRYEVRIPFKNYPPVLGESKQRAVARLLQLEKKFQKDKNLETEYKNFMKVYLDQKHMKKVEQQPVALYYIPHQAVLREESSTTKLRVVFDASSKTSTGVSLNETMHVGPRLQEDLFNILVRWRKHRIVLTADIEKMYRQILIHPDDQKYQRIVWRFRSSDPIEEYQLTTVTYGTTAAPYLAIRTLIELANNEEDNFQNASKILKNDFYVDDVLSGADTIEEAIQLQKELSALLKSGGFMLRKWSSNKQAVLKNLSDDLKDQTAIEITKNETKKSLGIHWCATEDTFRFKVDLAYHPKITKRNILSEIAKIFDPLGILAPVVITAKLLIQELWLKELDWDKAVPEELEIRWKIFTKQLKTLENLRVLRWINFSTHETKSFELHGFSDASEKAYGAAIYSRTVDKDGKVITTLLVAKSKVAQARAKNTLPRLELCAALLLTKLFQRTIKVLQLPYDVPTHAWTDSMITLAWIAGDPCRWKTFVANRVAEIKRIQPSLKWYHVKSEDNPADAISRGIDPSKLQSHAIWWNGPVWLANQDEWPKQVEYQKVVEERKNCFKATINEKAMIIERFSSFTRLLRVLSYCYRFINHCKKETKTSGFLTVAELQTVLESAVKMVQKEYFGKEISDLENKEQVARNSHILSLNPFIDDKGIVRAGGRLRNSRLPFEHKHPIILPYNSHLSRLILTDAHNKTLHGGSQTTLAYSRRKFWIINGKRAVNAMINRCVTCTRYKHQTANQIMGDLPSYRVTPSAPFQHTGVDYAGPISLRVSKGRGQKTYKGYIAVFVCLTTKAIHLEVVSDMTTDSFMAAFRRFVSRRGHCAHMYSDNGTYFVGASKVLQQEMKSVQETLVNTGTQWHFIPPASPHFGGMWEAGVKSTKHHLKRILGDSTLTYEELTTLLHQIEACLNSRPLCPINNNIEDIEVLTPGHLLIGRELIAPPNPITTNICSNVSSRWRLVQKLKEDFWKSWTNDYLNRLQQRPKWKLKQENIKIGDLVIIKDQTINPCRWPLGRVTETHPATDGTVRVVTIKRSTGNEQKRTVHNLIPLPVSSNEAEQKEEAKTNQAEHTSRGGGRKPIASLIITLMGFLMLAFPKPINANYTIKNIHPGIYVEHLGHTMIERGLFRMEVRYSRSKLNDSLASAYTVTDKFRKLCEGTNSLNKDIQCKSLFHHLEEQTSQLEWITEGIDTIGRPRERRGLLGNLLTSVFGVNDEVYKDIDALQKNQDELIKVSNHQTKLMLSALSTFNDTESRINNKLERFTLKLNKGIEAINKMNKWFAHVDINKLKIHVLGVYQMASNYIEELCVHYKKLMNVQFNRGNFYDIVLPAQISATLISAKKKLPPNLKILPLPVMKTAVSHKEDNISVYGFFAIVDTTKFLLIKATPIPLKISNGSYWMLDVSSDILAIDYNTQLYFEIPPAELQNKISIGRNEYLWSPAVVKNLENNQNCILDQIYNQQNTSSCKVKRVPFKNILWIELIQPNTWLYITDKPTQVAVICNGQREDVLLKNYGVIHPTHNCIIKSKRNVLLPKRVEHAQVISSYTKAVRFDIDTNADYPKATPIEEETVLRAMSDVQDLMTQEKTLQNELHEKVWRAVTVHSSLASGVTATLIILIITGLVWISYKLTKAYKTRNKNKSNSSQQAVEFELRPLS